MKIMYLTDQVFLHGGVEKVLSMKANWFAEHSDHEVIVLTTRQNSMAPIYRFSSKIRFLDLDIQHNIKKSYFRPQNIKKIPSHYRALKKIITQIEPDIIVSCNYAPDFYFLPFIKNGIPKIKEFHSSRFNSKPTTAKDQLLGALNTLVENKYDALAVLNEDEKAFYSSRNIAVIPNPSERSEGKATLGNKRVIAAGRLSPVKNFGELIDIWKIIAKAEPEWELHFYGEDYLDTKALLQKRVEEYGLDSVIKFKGVTEDMQKTMLDYSIYAMTSLTECFPMVLLEALSAGVPVVSYDAPTGPRNIVKNGEDGFLIEMGDHKKFAEKMLSIMNDENLRNKMGERAIENSHNFSIESVMKKWENLFIYLKTNKYKLKS